MSGGDGLAAGMGGQYIEPMSSPTPPNDAHPGKRTAASRPARLWRSLLATAAWPCEVCGSWAGDGLCGDCRRRFAEPWPACCPRCALPCPGGQVCGACLRQPPVFEGCVAAVPYAFPWDHLVARLKFQAQPELAGLLGDLMQRALAKPRTGPFLPAVQCVLPVPLSPARLAERGYNQAWELARRLARRQGLPARADLLLRLRDTPHQVGLSRTERQRNLRDAMWVDTRAGSLAGRHLALVDDVLTTGGTAAAATLALRAAGAASVQVWVLARTPAPSGAG